MKYEVLVAETHCIEVIVEAESLDEAETKALLYESDDEGLKINKFLHEALIVESKEISDEN